MMQIGKSGIHIKKSHKGDFTDYCGGKVTNACIAKGKASSNPKIRKQATFAANARTWKHQYGGAFNGPTAESVVNAAKKMRLEDEQNLKKIINNNMQSITDVMNPVATALAQQIGDSYSNWQLRKNAKDYTQKQADEARNQIDIKAQELNKSLQEYNPNKQLNKYFKSWLGTMTT